MQDPLSKKQIEFLKHGSRKWNIAHGSVRTGKTVGTLFGFMYAVATCPDSDIWMVGHTSETVYQNVVRLLFESPEFAIFKPFCSWVGGVNRRLQFKDKKIGTLGARDEGAIGNFQGKTFSLVLCDEMTLYPDSIIDMIDTRLSKKHSMGFASMNPSHPEHKIKKWIDKADEGDPNYYALHFTLDDNPFVDEGYKQRIRDSLSGLAYKRNYLGLWCLAEGAVFDFFDKSVHVVDRPPRAAEYWIASIDYGQIHPFVCLIIGVSTGRYNQEGKCMWVEKEYFWDSRVKERQKTNSEFARDLQEFLEPYAIKNIYMDPSAEAFHLELRRLGMHVTHANNDVMNGITHTASEMAKGNLYICAECKNTIRQIEGYVWDSKKAKLGRDEPVKVEDDAPDALRYAIHSHKVATYDPYKHNAQDYLKNRFGGGSVF
jgi:PBSX family phage terminase large subunit